MAQKIEEIPGWPVDQLYLRLWECGPNSVSLAKYGAIVCFVFGAVVLVAFSHTQLVDAIVLALLLFAGGVWLHRSSKEPPRWVQIFRNSTDRIVWLYTTVVTTTGNVGGGIHKEISIRLDNGSKVVVWVYDEDADAVLARFASLAPYATVGFSDQNRAVFAGNPRSLLRVRLDAAERVVLSIVERGQGRFDWHEIAVRLSTFDVERGRDLMAVLMSLRARGLVVNVSERGRHDRWVACTDGAAPVVSAPPPSKDDALIGALRAGPSVLFQSHQALVADVDAFDAELHRLLVERHDAVDAVARGALLLPESARAAFARELWTSPDVERRRALFQALEPLRLDVQGGGWRAFLDDDWNAFVRAGLADVDGEVRRMAAALVFANADGAPLARELMDNLRRGDRAEHGPVLLALGSARDADSLAVLRAALAGADAGLAAYALRALAARPDGRDDAVRVLVDNTEARDAVRAAASFALSAIIDSVEPAQLAALERAAADSPALAEALSRFRSRAA